MEQSGFSQGQLKCLHKQYFTFTSLPENLTNEVPKSSGEMETNRLPIALLSGRELTYQDRPDDRATASELPFDNKGTPSQPWTQ